MGRVKAEMMEREGKVQRALFYCVKVGAIEVCKRHGEHVDTLEFQEQKELTQRILDEVDDALEGFDSPEELEECVGEALAFAGEECGSCENERNS
jgi:hypothetical protein